jgi:hypothetical protein
MGEILGVIAIITFLAVVIIATFVSEAVGWVKRNPKEYRKNCAAFADAASMPLFIYQNLAHNIKAHRQGLRKISALSDTDAVNQALADLREEVIRTQTQTETIEHLRSLTDEEVLKAPQLQFRERRAIKRQ